MRQTTIYVRRPLRLERLPESFREATLASLRGWAEFWADYAGVDLAEGPVELLDNGEIEGYPVATEASVKVGGVVGDT